MMVQQEWAGMVTQCTSCGMQFTIPSAMPIAPAATPVAPVVATVAATPFASHQPQTQPHAKPGIQEPVWVPSAAAKQTTKAPQPLLGYLIGFVGIPAMIVALLVSAPTAIILALLYMFFSVGAMLATLWKGHGIGMAFAMSLLGPVGLLILAFLEDRRKSGTMTGAPLASLGCVVSLALPWCLILGVNALVAGDSDPTEVVQSDNSPGDQDSSEDVAASDSSTDDQSTNNGSAASGPSVDKSPSTPGGSSGTTSEKKRITFSPIKRPKIDDSQKKAKAQPSPKSTEPKTPATKQPKKKQSPKTKQPDNATGDDKPDPIGDDVAEPIGSPSGAPKRRGGTRRPGRRAPPIQIGGPNNDPNDVAKTKPPTQEDYGKEDFHWSVEVDPQKSIPKFRKALALNIPIGRLTSSNGIHFAPGMSPYFARGSAFGRTGISLFDLRTGKKVSETPPLQLFSRGIAVCPQGRYIGFASTRSKGVMVWDVAKKKMLKTLPMNTINNKYLEFSRLGSGKVLGLGGGFGPALNIWDLPSRQADHSLGITKHLDKESLTVSCGGRYVAFHETIYKPGLRVYDLQTGKLAGSIRTQTSATKLINCHDMAFSPDGKELAGIFYSGFTEMLWVFDVKTGKRVFEHTFPGGGASKRITMGLSLGESIQWFPDRRRWLIYGHMVFDRGKKDFSFTFPDDHQSRQNRKYRKVLTNELITTVGGDRRNAQLMSVQVK